MSVHKSCIADKSNHEYGVTEGKRTKVISVLFLLWSVCNLFSLANVMTEEWLCYAQLKEINKMFLLKMHFAHTHKLA